MLKKTHLIVLLFTLTLLAACGPTAVPQKLPTSIPSATPQVVPPTEVEKSQAPPADLSQITFNDQIFTSVDNCKTCHSGLVDEKGNDVSNIGDWSSSIMAHATVDPYYLATVNAEVARHPKYQAAIEDKCATCHMPMAHFAIHAEGGTSTILGENGYQNPKHPLHEMATESISCTVCHQIQAENLGEDTSFSGGMQFDTTSPKSERILYGPYPAEEPYAGIMTAGSGYLIKQSDHLSQSEMCATCHTLETHYLLANGNLAEETFPEQMPYQEWLASDYATEQSCQDCHMPQVEGEVAISIMGSPPRSPFYLHTFTGGNAYMLDILKKFENEIAVQSDSTGFDEAIQRTQTLLQEATATISIDSAQINEGQLGVDVSIQSQVGHKFPSGFPSRRAWLHLTVLDEAGNLLFQSGGYETNGTIIGNDNDVDETTFEPHYTEINAEDQVQIYESIMQDVEGNVTTALLIAQGYIKDNRLLPSGFDKNIVDEKIAVYGEAAADGNFIGSGDSVHYEITLDAASAPLTVEVELLYQSIGYRWAQNLGMEESSQIDDFLRYYDETPNLPIVIAKETISVSP